MSLSTLNSAFSAGPHLARAAALGWEWYALKEGKNLGSSTPLAAARCIPLFYVAMGLAIGSLSAYNAKLAWDNLHKIRGDKV